MTLANTNVTAPKIDRSRRVYRSIRRSRYYNLNPCIAISPSGMLGTYEIRGSKYTISEISRTYITENILCVIEGAVAHSPQNFIVVLGIISSGNVENFEMIHPNDSNMLRSTKSSW